MAGPVAKAFVEVHPDLAKFEPALMKQVLAAMRGAVAAVKSHMSQIESSIADSAASGGRAFDGMVRDINQALARVGNGGFDDVVAQASSAGAGIFEAFANAAQDANDQLGLIGRTDFGDPDDTANSTAQGVMASFVDAADAASVALAKIGDTNFGGVQEQARIAGAGIERSFDQGGAGAERATGMHLGRVGALIAAAGAAALAKPIIIGVQAAASLEQTEIAFTSLYGSVEEAQRRIAEFQQFAAETPFEFPDLISSAQKLKAVGFAADEIIPSLTAIGDVAATLGVGSANINQVTFAMQQMTGAGKVMTQDLYQLQNALPGFNVFGVLADSMGVSTGEIRDMISDGLVPSEQAIQDLLAGMREFPGAAGAMERQATTLNGMMSTFKDTARLALVEGFGPLVQVLKDGLGSATPIIEGLINAIAPPLAEIGATLIPALLSAVESLTPVFGDVFGVLAEVIGLAAPVAADLLDALTPILSVIVDLASAALPPLIDVLSALIDMWAPVIEIAGEFVSELAGRLAPILGEVADLLVGLYEGFGPVLVQAMEAVVDTVDALFTALEPVLPIIIDVAGVLLGSLASALRTLVSAIAPVLPRLGELVGMLVAELAPILPPLANAIGQVVSMLADALAPVLPEIIELASAFLEAVLPLLPPLIDLAVAVLPPLVDVLGFLIPLFVETQTIMQGPFLAALEMIVGPIQVVADVLGAVAGVIGTVQNAIGDVVDALNPFETELTALSTVAGPAFKKMVDDQKAAVDAAADRQEYYTSRITAAQAPMQVLASETGNVTDALYLERIEMQSAATDTDALMDATLLLEDRIAQLYSKMDEEDAWAKFHEKMWEYRADTDLTEQETRDYERAILDMALAVENIPDTSLTHITALLEDGDIDAAEAALENLTRLGRWRVVVGAETRGDLTGVIRQYASGTTSAPPGPAWVGERGPELMWMRGGERVMPHNESMAYAAQRGPTQGAGIQGPLVHIDNYHAEAPVDEQSLARTTMTALDLRIR